MFPFASIHQDTFHIPPNQPITGGHQREDKASVVKHAAPPSGILYTSSVELSTPLVVAYKCLRIIWHWVGAFGLPSRATESWHSRVRQPSETLLDCLKTKMIQLYTELSF